jgi:hypothetical protein
MRTQKGAVFVYVIIAAFAAAAPASAGGSRLLESAVTGLEPDQKIRIQTRDFHVLRGYFVRAAGDSLYLRSDGADAVGYPDIERMWAHEPHGAGRGALWASGVLVLGGALILGMGAETEDDVIRLTGLMVATVVMAGYAFYKGASGATERMVYSRYLE